MPTQIKLTYDVLKNRLNADYCYETVFSNDKDKTAYDILEEWYNSEKTYKQYRLLFLKKSH